MKEILIVAVVVTLYPYILRILDMIMQLLENKATSSATKTQVKINELMPEEVPDCQPIGFQYDYGADVEYLDEDEYEENKMEMKSVNRIGY